MSLIDPLSIAGLNELLGSLNRWRADNVATPEARLTERYVELLFRPSRRLAVYGSLAPGRENHHLLAGIDGEWFRGQVRGRLHQTGWGSELGYPALSWEADGEDVGVWVLSADELERRWAELDRFEGPEYYRGLVPVFEGPRLICVSNLYLAV